MSTRDRSLDTFQISHLGLTASIELSQVDAVLVITVETDNTIGNLAAGLSKGPLCRIYINDHKLHGIGPLGGDTFSAREEIEPIMRQALGGRVLWEGMTCDAEGGELIIDDARTVNGHGVEITICTAGSDAVPVVYVDTIDLEENETGPICRIFLNDTDLHNNGWDG